MSHSLRYSLSLLLIGLASFVATLLVVRPESSGFRTPSDRTSTTETAVSDPERAAERATLLREGGYTNAQIAGRLTSTLQECGMAIDWSGRQQAEEVLLAVSREHGVSPMTILAAIDCRTRTEGTEDFWTVARRAAARSSTARGVNVK
jgi:hypothetical protein